MSIHDDDFSNFTKNVSQIAKSRRDYMRCSKRVYIYGAEKKEMPLGTKLIVNFLDATRGYERREAGKIVEKRMPAMRSAEREPKREELGHDDQSQWPISTMNNEPEDPWRKSYEIPCRELDGEQRWFILAGNSAGFGIAWDEFFAACGRQAGVNPGKVPVVELSLNKFKAGKFGMVDRPSFPIVQWVVSDDEDNETDGDFAEDLDNDPPF